MRCSRADKKGRGNAAASTTGPDGNPWPGVAALLHNANSQQRDERQRLSGRCSPFVCATGKAGGELYQHRTRSDHPVQLLLRRAVRPGRLPAQPRASGSAPARGDLRSLPTPAKNQTSGRVLFITLRSPSLAMGSTSGSHRSAMSLRPRLPWVGSCVEAALYRRGYETEPSLEEGDSSVMATRPHRNYSKRPYANLWRYETALSRSWSGTLHELQRLQAKRAWRAGPDNNRGGRRHQYKRERRATDPE